MWRDPIVEEIHHYREHIVAHGVQVVVKSRAAYLIAGRAKTAESTFHCRRGES